MAHQNKFVSVNLNRSYGRPSSSSPSSAFGHGRSRFGSVGGMVVLSRPRSSSASVSKSATRLAVPPPLNLPSLRKEHEHFDPASSGASTGHGTSGLGSGAGSTAMGWNKPAIHLPSAEDSATATSAPSQLFRSTGSSNRLSGSAYVPPGSRPGTQLLPASLSQVFAEKAVILRGEDFPSLRATALALKQKENSGQKQKQKQIGGDRHEGIAELPDSRPPIEMRPEMRSSQFIMGNAGYDDVRSNLQRNTSELSQKNNGYLPSPLPLVRLQHTSDWADDERDTDLSLPERARDSGFSRFQSVESHEVYEGGEFFNGYSFRKDAKPAVNGRHDFGSWKIDRLSAHEFAVDKDRHDVRLSSANTEVVQPPFGDKGQDSFSHGNQDSWYPRRDMGSHMNTQNIKAPAETFSGRSVEQNARGRYADPSNNSYKGGPFHNNSIAKNHSSSVNKLSSLIDPVTSFSKEKRSLPSAGKPYTVETGFDSKDPFSGDVKFKLFKKKKDGFKQTYFHDPIRESFEAELDRILMTQEQERKRIMEERARMLAQARKQEEERERLAIEEDERRRLLEEEAREAAWRAEQENLEAAKRIEEQRIAREEEKKIYQIEEERRKEAARRKLLELEARMARRQAEEKPEVDGLPSADDERISSSAKKRDISQLGDMEDGERMMESIPTFVSSDNLGMNRNLDAGSRSQSSSSRNLPFMALGKHSLYSSSLPVQDHVQRSPRLDAFGSRRSTFKKEIHGGCSTMNARASSKGGSGEPSETFDDYRQPRHHPWNNDTDGDHFRKNFDLDIDRLNNEKFVEAGWDHGNSHGRPQAQYGERSLQSFEVDELPSFTRYRQLLRQPRVPPPPSVTSSLQSSFGPPVDRDNTSSVGDKTYHLPGRNELQNSQAGYDSSYHDTLRPISVTPSLEENAHHSEQMQEKINSGCDSLSTLSISSAPNSPTHLLHDEMDVTGDSPALPTSADGERTIVSDNEHVKSTMEFGTLNRMTTSSSVSLGEDDDWGTHEQEYHGDEEDDYQEIDEVHECGNDSLDMKQKIDDSHSDGQTPNEEMEQVILGFDEGVEVKIPVNNDFEMTSRNEDKEIVHQTCPPSIENVLSYRNNNIPEVTVNDSLSVIRDTEKAMQGLVLDPVATSYATNTLEVSLSSVMSPQHISSPSPSLTQMPTSTLSSLSCSATVSQGEEASVKLQFGLFSGPSLIPSPISAIQIGSIQMPIHVHTQITPSLHHVHPSQPPLFQFGLLRYPPPVSQNVLPLAPQNMSCIPPHVPAPFSFNRKPADCLSNQASQDSCHSKLGEENHSCSSNKQSGFPSNFGYEHVNASPDPVKSGTMASQNQTERCPIAEKKNNIGFVSHQHDDMPAKQSPQPYQEQLVEMLRSHCSVGNAPAKVRGVFSASRGKRYACSARDYGSRLPFPGVENISNGFQRARRSTCRTEFRVRENVEKRQISGTELLDYVKQDEKSNANGRTSVITARSVGKKDVALNRSFRISESNDLSLGSSSSRVASSDVKTLSAARKDSASKIVTPYGKSNALKSKLNSDEDVDAPLQSGVICVFKQPGIETPSDEDDFIKVRSKRQMLNDRREQREKENKSKSKVLKMPRKQHIALQSNVPISNSKKAAISLFSDASNNVHSSSLVAVRKDPSKHGHSLAFASNTSQTLSPIGTSLVNVDSEARSSDLKPSQGISYPAESTDMMKRKCEYMNHSSPINTWESRNVNKQVMALTQTQLDEAMKPAQFDSPLAPNISLESKIISCIMTQEKSFPSCSSTTSSLLGGEKIQFGAVTSPTILPPVNRAISNSLGPPGSNRSEVKTNPTLVATKDDCVMFFGKEKHHGKSFTSLEDHEAEAAASAVAVAAISNDEVVASGVGDYSASATSDSKSFNNSDVTGLTSGDFVTGGTMSQVSNGPSAGEESLTIALPADLSVDTPSLSLWPPLPSPQASGPMLSHYPGAQPSQFPCFDMNSVLDGHIFAYGPNDESSGSQEQSQRSGNLGSGSLGAWPQCHSGVDSFYGPPTGFAGPFISPGGIPGVQGPPHMVFYNHFSPVGRFGQLGLSFMGTTYLTASNPSEQKQNQVCSTSGEGKDDCNSANVSIQQTSPGMAAPIQHLGPASSLMPVSGQGPMPNMPGTIQHLGPGSPLMQMASPLTMFDITPFQSATGIPMQGHWPHVPAPPLHSVQLAIPSQQLHESGMSTQFDQSLPIDTSLVSNRFQDSISSLPVGVSTIFPALSSRESCFPHELGLLERPISTTGSTQSVRSSHTAGGGNSNEVTRTATRTMVTSLSDNGSIGANSSASNTGTASKSKQPSSSGPQYLNPAGHLDKQGGAAQKNVSGGEWHRRAGFHRRKQGSGSDKNFGSSKMKQIYVPKPSSNTASNQS